MARERGPFDDQFEQGHVPMDAPPGFEEREYKAWKESGGVVLRDVPAELDRCKQVLEDFLRFRGAPESRPQDNEVLHALCRLVLRQ